MNNKISLSGPVPDGENVPDVFTYKTDDDVSVELAHHTDDVTWSVILWGPYKKPKGRKKRTETEFDNLRDAMAEFWVMIETVGDNSRQGNCQHPKDARVYEKQGSEVMGVRCKQCGVHL